MMRRLFVFLAILLSASLGVRLIQRSLLSDGVSSVCDLVNDHFYRLDKAWVGHCRRLAASVRPWESRAHVLSRLQGLMDTMEVSHFEIYSPQEDTKIWKGEAVDTGIRARWVEDHLVVYHVLPKSNGEKIGILPGDDILKINGSGRISPWAAQNRPGLFELRRNSEIHRLEVTASPMRLDSAPQLRALDNHTGILSISSFRAEYFAVKNWQEMAQRLPRFSALVIDLRDNAGGNFVAMLRVLSTFYCDPREVGRVIQPRKQAPEAHAFLDVTDDKYQIDELARFHALQLKTFGNYGCYRGPVTVLTNSDSASVSEIFAEAIKARAKTRVWGQPTAGNVVLAVWYDLPLIGAGFSVSIPEAVYHTLKNQDLEGRGVWPDQELFYDLTTALQGKDSWLERAVQQPF